MGLVEHGYFSDEELAKLPGVPSQERLAQGPVAVIECGQCAGRTVIRGPLTSGYRQYARRPGWHRGPAVCDPER